MMTCDNKSCTGDPNIVHIERFRLWIIDVLESSPSERILSIDLCRECKGKFKLAILDVVLDMKGTKEG